MSKYRQMNRYLLLSVVLMLSLSCDNNKGKDTSATQASLITLSGSAIKGTLDGASIEIYVNQSIAATGQTTKDGTFKVSFQAGPNDNIMVEVYGGRDKGAPFMENLSLLVDASKAQASGAINLDIHPLSTLESEIANRMIRQGQQPGAALAMAKKIISAMFGINSSDKTFDVNLPKLPTDQQQVATALISEGLAELAKTKGSRLREYLRKLADNRQSLTRSEIYQAVLTVVQNAQMNRSGAQLPSGVRNLLNRSPSSGTNLANIMSNMQPSPQTPSSPKPKIQPVTIP